MATVKAGSISPWSIVRWLRRRTIKPRQVRCLRDLYGKESIDVRVEARPGGRSIVSCWIDAHFQDQHLQLLTGLKDLEALTLYFIAIPAAAQVTEAGLVHLRAFPKLTNLSLAGCQRISDAGLAHVGQLPNLRSLRTDQMRHLTDAAVTHLRGLTKLRQLALNDTGIAGAGLRHLDGLHRLRELSLAACPIENAALKQVVLFPQLLKLCLRSTFSRITDAGLAALGTHPRLQELDLWDNSLLRGPGLKHLARLPNLTWLTLNGTRIEEKHLRHLAACPRLELLALSNTPIADGAVDHLVRLTGLRKLHLDQTKISGAALRRLAALPNLTHLTVPDQAKPEDVRFLRHALPGLQVSA